MLATAEVAWTETKNMKDKGMMEVRVKIFFRYLIKKGILFSTEFLK